MARARIDSDEHYVIDLCDEVIGERAIRQHRFEWLLGDPGKNGSSRRLPVDAFWPARKLVVEYRERQHDEPTPFFDKPSRFTVSGVHRGEQRKLYDQRREEVIPRQGIALVLINARDLDVDQRGRLRRNRDADLIAVRRILDASVAR